MNQIQKITVKLLKAIYSLGSRLLFQLSCPMEVQKKEMSVQLEFLSFVQREGDYFYWISSTFT